MRSKTIIRKAMVLLTKQQAAFASLEKHFYIPAMAVYADDVILAEAHVRADYGNPILAIITVADRRYLERTRRFLLEAKIFLMSMDFPSKM